MRGRRCSGDCTGKSFRNQTGKHRSSAETPRVPEEPSNPNPIVALAMKIRSQHEKERKIDATLAANERLAMPDPPEGVLQALHAFGYALQDGCKRLNAILGPNGVVFVRLENPLRLRLRFITKRVALNADVERQLVTIQGLGLDGDYQFDTSSQTPALINLSKLSTEAGYGQALTASSLLKLIAQDAELPHPHNTGQ